MDAKDKLHRIREFLEAIKPLQNDVPNCPPVSQLVFAIQGEDSEAAEHAKSCQHCKAITQVLEASSQNRERHLQDFLAVAQARGAEAAAENPASFWKYVWASFTRPTRVFVGVATACLLIVAVYEQFNQFVHPMPPRNTTVVSLPTDENANNYADAIKAFRSAADDLKETGSVDVDMVKHIQTTLAAVRLNQLSSGQLAELTTLATDYNTVARASNPPQNAIETPYTKRLSELYTELASLSVHPSCIKLEEIKPGSTFVVRRVEGLNCGTEPEKMTLAMQRFANASNTTVFLHSSVMSKEFSPKGTSTSLKMTSDRD
jgi:hypothetical protein